MSGSRIVCGLQPVREAIRAHGAELERVLVEVEGREPSPQLEALARFARDHGARVERLARGELDRLARGVRHQGTIAFAPGLPIGSLDDVAVDEHTLVVALDEVQDPQNFGAVIRSAVALGATAIVWPEHHAAPLSPATFRASAGAVEHAALCRVAKLPSALSKLADAGASVVGLDANAEKALADIELPGAVVLVIGAEGKGLRKPVKSACTALAKLPMKGPIDSLNASVAAGIALYDVLRRR